MRMRGMMNRGSRGVGSSGGRNEAHNSGEGKIDQNKDGTKALSPRDAFFHLVKGNLGPGCLNLPYAFATVGWKLGTGLFLLVACQGIYAMWLLVRCQRHLRAEQQQLQPPAESEEGPLRRPRERTDAATRTASGKTLTYMEVARLALGPWGERAVEVNLFVCQGGVCCAFLSLLATELVAAGALRSSGFGGAAALSSHGAILLVTPILMALVLLRSLKDLVCLSGTANLCMVLAIFTAAISGIIAVSGHGDEGDGAADDQDAASAPATGTSPALVVSFVSAMLYAFEGIGLVLPIENNYGGGNDGQGCKVKPTATEAPLPQPTTTMLLPSDNNNHSTKDNFSVVLVGAMSVTAGLFVLVGVAASMGFPSIDSGSITAWLEETYPDVWWYGIVNDLVMLAVLLTYALQFTPAMEVLDGWLDKCAATSLCCRRNADGHNRFQNVHGDDLEEEEKEEDGAAPTPTTKGCCCLHQWMLRRWCFVWACSGFVWLVQNNLSLIMSLFGSIGQTGLAGMPCVIHLALQRQGRMPSAGIAQKILDILVIVFNGVVMLYGSSVAIAAIVRAASS